MSDCQRCGGRANDAKAHLYLVKSNVAEGATNTARPLTTHLSKQGVAAMQSSEQWRPVPDFEGFVEVSNLGRVRSLDRVIDVKPSSRSKSGHTRVFKGRILKQARHPRGYMYITIAADHRVQPNLKVHHLVLEAFVGPRPDGTEACHANDIPDDNRAENLRWDTPEANIQDRVRMGKQRRTHCTRGHEYTPENSLPSTTPPFRRCRQCAREMARVGARRRRAQRKAGAA